MPARTVSDSLVLGTWGLSGRGRLPIDRSYGEVADDVAYETMDRAWEAGLRIIDTAPGYGAGEGLRRVGQWQRTRGRWWRNVAKPGRPLTGRGPVSDLSLPGLVAEIEYGAAFAGRPGYILVKDPDIRSFSDGSLAETLRSLENRFPAATVGVASHFPETLAEFAERCHPPGARIAQIELNAVNHRVACPAAGRLDARGWEVWAMQPLAYGFLAHPDFVPIPGTDWRSHLPAETQAVMRAAARGFARAVHSVREPGSPPTARTTAPAAWAIAFCLSVPSVKRIVIGPKNAAQLEAALHAVDLVSKPDLAERLRTWATGAPNGSAGSES
ncbi:aldo/keto reductase [Streptomyces sp. NPDC059371]|uniref:aldo/keto reductase n=1 Tax=Streptomyces sp. NPDC059371 TaxID=3346812 RepID=UPI003695285A